MFGDKIPNILLKPYVAAHLHDNASTKSDTPAQILPIPPKKRNSWLVVYLPLWKIWVRQLGLIFPMYGNIIHSCSKPPTRVLTINIPLFTTIHHWFTIDSPLFTKVNQDILTIVMFKYYLSTTAFEVPWDSRTRMFPGPLGASDRRFAASWVMGARCSPFEGLVYQGTVAGTLGHIYIYILYIFNSIYIHQLFFGIQ